eukprot:6198437-Pleurochrysis_carterae.AAC.3
MVWHGRGLDRRRYCVGRAQMARRLRFQVARRWQTVSPVTRLAEMPHRFSSKCIVDNSVCMSHMYDVPVCDSNNRDESIAIISSKQVL